MAIYNGTQKVSMSGIDKIYVGTTLVYQKQSAKVLTSITLSGQTTTLTRDDAFSFDGTVTANYSDGSTEDVTNSTTFSGYNMSLGGTYTVTATYIEDDITVTATYTLTVNKKWSSIWTGTRDIKVDNGTTSGVGNNFASTVNGTGYSPIIKVTYSNWTSSGTSTYRYNNGSSSSSKVSSPVSMTTSIPSSGNYYIMYVKGANSTSVYGWAHITAARDTSNNRIRFSSGAGRNGNFTGTAQIKITNIEQYY